MSGSLLMQDKRACAVLKIYRRIDAYMRRFSYAHGITCPPGCGSCCESDRVETTLLEVLPLGYELWKKGEAEYWLTRLAGPPHPGRCVFYNPDPSVPGNGRCSVYALRPLVCRLFGFTCRDDKYGNPVLVTCRVIKKSSHRVPADIRPPDHAAVSTRLIKPLDMTEMTFSVAAIDPHLGTLRLPMNEALRRVFEKIGLQLGCAAAERQPEGSGTHRHLPDDDHDRGDKPTSPRKAA